MPVDDWLAAARADADRRGMAELKPLLDMLAEATRVLRSATWNRDAAGAAPPAETADAPGRDDTSS